MTKDGLVERNAATGEETRTSQRGQDFDFRQGQSADYRQGAQLPPQDTPPQNRQQHHNQRRGRLDKDVAHSEQPDGGRQPAFSAPENTENSTQNTTNPAYEAGAYKQSPHSPAARHSGENPQKTHPNDTANASKPPHRTKQPGRLQFSEEQPQDSAKKKSQQHGTKYQQKFVPEGENPGDTATPPKNAAPDTPKPSGNTSRLQFAADELPPDPDHKLSKLKGKAEKADHKLDKARKKLPSKRKAKIERVFDEEKGKSKHTLKFEKEVIPQGGKKKSLPGRAGKAAGGAVIRTGTNALHKKINEVEKDNVGVEAAHRTELAAEGMYRSGRSALRFTRNRRYRTAAKLEKKAVKANAKYAYQKVLAENSKLKSNLLSRLAQKQKIKRQYAKAAREVKRAGQTAKKAGSAAAKAARAVTNLIRSHPMIVGAIVLILLIMFFMFTMFASCSNMAGSGFTSVIMSSYTAEDADIIAVENAYVQLETELETRIGNIENEYPGYDEYRYSCAQIGHDPFALASYLTSLYYDYTPSEVQAELQTIFGQQYILTVTEEVEVRYRTETRTDSEGNSYTVEVAYNYYILNVTLENNSLYSVANANLDADQLEMFGIYMETKGNKEYLFEGNVYIDRGGDTGGYTIPGDALSDPQFAALIAEAEKYLGYPYVWGGSSPSTSFDCSGFVCYVLNQSGSASVGRTTANGLRNMCTIVSASEAKPGDLIFFQGTYNTTGASHVGIYVGNGMMIHCGSPIQYTSIETSYWQSHFYGFGRYYSRR